VFQAPKLEPWIVRYELSAYEWAALKPFLHSITSSRSCR
jgi:hypothetical protein